MQNTKYVVQPSAIRALRIMIQDHNSTVVNYGPADLQQFYNRLEDLQSQLNGTRPFEGTPSFHELPQIECMPGEQLSVYFFYCERKNARHVKNALRQNLSLISDPHSMNVNGEKTSKEIYFSIRDVTETEAKRCVEANPEIITRYQRIVSPAKEKKQRIIVPLDFHETVSETANNAEVLQVQSEQAELPHIDETEFSESIGQNASETTETAFEEEKDVSQTDEALHQLLENIEFSEPIGTFEESTVENDENSLLEI